MSTARADAGIPGNCNGDERFDIADPVFLLRFLFGSGSDPDCLARCDYQQDRQLDLSDVISMLNYLTVGGQPPAPIVLPPEVCGDGIDNNCDGQIDEGCTSYDIDVLWDPVLSDIHGNPEATAGYRVYWGTASGSYDFQEEIHGCSCGTLNGLKAGSTYYAVVSAFDDAGNESGFSNEIQLQR